MFTQLKANELSCIVIKIREQICREKEIVFLRKLVKIRNGEYKIQHLFTFNRHFV